MIKKSSKTEIKKNINKAQIRFKIKERKEAIKNAKAINGNEQ